MLCPHSIEDVQQVVRQYAHLIPCGGGTKTALSISREGWEILYTTGLAGVVEYNPSEYTFTALAGTRVVEVQALLASHGQYLPCDPPLAAAGATLGGTVAAGLSGPGRYRYGGVRDFILGVRFVDGAGRLVHGGGKVVKNAAGFDLPKLMVGSLGEFGVLVELTFKVFPRASAFVTVRVRCPLLETIMAALYRVYTARLEIDSLDLTPELDGGWCLWARLGGLPEALAARAGRLLTLLGGGDVIATQDEGALWQAAVEFEWVPARWNLVKVPITPKKIVVLEAAIKPMQTQQRYSAGGNVAWIATPAPVSELDLLLSRLDLPGLLVLGSPDQAHRVRIGARYGQILERRVKLVLDPMGKFSTEL